MNFDLNIDNYKIKELEEIFNLSNNYDTNIILLNENKLKENILKNDEINEDIKIKTIHFVTKAKNILLCKLDNNNHNFQEIINEFYNSSFELKSVNTIDNYGHIVQERKDKPYLSSYPSEFFPGIINPIKKKTNRINLNIDTRFRDNYYGSQSTNFNITLPLQLNNILTMQLNAIELPTSFYVISKQSGNNFFTITANIVGDTPISNVIEIPDGNYSDSSLISLLNVYLNDLGGVFQNIVFGENIVLPVTGNGKTYVGINSTYVGPDIEFSLNFQADKYGNDDRNTPLPLKFGWLLGFRNGIYINNPNYISEGIINLIGSRYIYLVVDDHNNNVNNNFYSAFNSSVLNKNILARISIYSDRFSVFSENNLNLVTYPRQYYGPVNILNMNIQLLDEFGRIINLNNMDFSFCLTFQSVYDI
jgi:hypothetical protein